MTRVLPAALLLPLCAALAFAQSDDPFRVRGVVLEIGPNTPLPGAQVTLYHFGLDRARSALDTTVTDSTGAFQFQPTRPGEYYVEITKPDYFSATQMPAPNRPGQASTGALVSLNKDHPSEELRFAMLRFGTLKGKAVDEDGNPVSGLMVEFIPSAIAPAPGLSTLAMRTGRSALTTGNGSFHSAGLIPGRYVIRVSEGAADGNYPTVDFTEKDEEVVDQALAPAYWPGVTDRASAATIVVDPAGDADLGTIVLHKEPRYRVRLLVQGCEPGDQLTLQGPGLPGLPNVTLLANFGELRSLVASAMPCKDVLARHLRSGTYTLIATTKHSAATASVVITDRNVRTPFSLSPDGDVLGRVTMASGEPPPPGEPVLQLRGSRITPDAKGNFTISNVQCLPAPLQITRLSAKYYVKELRVNGSAVTGTAAPLCGGSRLEVVLDDKLATLTVTASDGDTPASEPMILLQPRGVSLLNRPQAARNADKSGSVQIANLPPGDYQVLAVRPVTLPEGDTIQQIASELWEKATNITVDPGESKSVSLKLLDPFLP